MLGQIIEGDRTRRQEGGRHLVDDRMISIMLDMDISAKQDSDESIVKSLNKEGSSKRIHMEIELGKHICSGLRRAMEERPTPQSG